VEERHVDPDRDRDQRGGGGVPGMINTIKAD
jgi:hypothetical protein